MTIKACPFCGKKGAKCQPYHDCGGEGDRIGWRIGCACGAEGPLLKIRRLAREAWNRRQNKKGAQQR